MPLIQHSKGGGIRIYLSKLQANQDYIQCVCVCRGGGGESPSLPTFLIRVVQVNLLSAQLRLVYNLLCTSSSQLRITGEGCDSGGHALGFDTFLFVCLFISAVAHAMLGTEQSPAFVSVFLDSKDLMNLVTSSQGKYMRSSTQGNQ